MWQKHNIILREYSTVVIRRRTGAGFSFSSSSQFSAVLILYQLFCVCVCLVFSVSVFVEIFLLSPESKFDIQQEIINKYVRKVLIRDHRIWVQYYIHISIYYTLLHTMIWLVLPPNRGEACGMESHNQAVRRTLLYFFDLRRSEYKCASVIFLVNFYGSFYFLLPYKVRPMLMLKTLTINSIVGVILMVNGQWSSPLFYFLPL
jgi:hypothetical protein